MTVLRFFQAVRCCFVFRVLTLGAATHLRFTPTANSENRYLETRGSDSQTAKSPGSLPWGVCTQCPVEKRGGGQSTESQKRGGDRTPKGCTRKRMAWHRLMRRVFEIDVLQCPKCKGRMTMVSFIIQRSVIRKILKHLGQPGDTPKLSPPRFKQTCFDY